MCVLSLKTIQILFLLLVVVSSNEQSTVRFTYATPYAPNPVFTGFPRYQNVLKEIDIPDSVVEM